MSILPCGLGCCLLACDWCLRNSFRFASQFVCRKAHAYLRLLLDADLSKVVNGLFSHNTLCREDKHQSVLFSSCCLGRSRKWKVFETARAARKAASKSSRDSSVRLSTSTSSWKDSNSSNSLTPSNVNSDAESFNSDGYHADMDSLYG